MRLFKKKQAAAPKVEEKDAEQKSAAPAKVEKKVEKKAAAKTTTRKNTMPGVLLYPLVSEKGTRLQTLGTYQFAVAQKANKIQIGKAVQARYGIKPTKVRVMHRLGKKVRFGRLHGKRADWKRALVTLPKGKTIDVHEGV